MYRGLKQRDKIHSIEPTGWPSLRVRSLVATTSQEQNSDRMKLYGESLTIMGKAGDHKLILA